MEHQGEHYKDNIQMLTAHMHAYVVKESFMRHDVDSISSSIINHRQSMDLILHQHLSCLIQTIQLP